MSIADGGILTPRCYRGAQWDQHLAGGGSGDQLSTPCYFPATGTGITRQPTEGFSLIS